MDRWRPGGGPLGLRRQGPGSLFGPVWDRFFRPFWEETFGEGPSYGLIEPAIDVFETDEHMVVKAELPGIDPSALKVSVTQDSIGFRGEAREEHEANEEGYHWRERRHGLVQRLVPLARQVDPESARASFRNGVLTVRAQKVQGERVRTVEINVENEQTGYGPKPERGRH